MDNSKRAETIEYILRHLLTFNITDPLSTASRGICDHTQYFSGTNTIGQINYLERKPTSSGRFIVKVDGVEKALTTDYTLNKTTGRITWVTAAATGNDNIEVYYQCIKPWIYDDYPVRSISSWPRITVDTLGYEYEDRGIGIYANYTAGIGQFVTIPTKIIIWNRENTNTYTYNSIGYKNYALVAAISESIENYINTNRVPIPWRFWDWQFRRAERNRSEEEEGIFRRDITLDVKIFKGA